ncbi:TetR/AcrR family transcriptional regulator [Oceanotoga sp. DSM 15011]|uniref:TetR family transcriptional regulator n=1 Tax=Oceanotoga teriensis TaxID=515440 RepID=A0AA45C6D1_9BACT|nr:MULTISPECIES: TetR/AcrR family transcriptional regulator [Oceanotoga]MDN5343479.1 hypothetical protein [Oceanotoga sp.]MDO7977533.1 TetR/AcrR family transcriptional regulator [Oceanotoga teriensis]PWJ91247.1 TetR family transcriptional regulator [Oceanotoga teriensis]UYO99722.1 TetR/AcrR family transcriptional regulator [Oceanotoga sp. DSM 15011]
MNNLTNRQKQAINTKFKITEIALELFKSKGIKKVKIKDICNKANVSIGTFYHYFDSKEKILEKSYIQIDSMIAENIENIVYENNLDRILKLFNRANILIEDLGWRFVADAYTHLLTSEDRYSLCSKRYPYVLIKESLEKGIIAGEFLPNFNPEEVSEVCMRLGRGMVFDWCLHKGSYSLTSESEKSIITYLKTFQVKI